MPHGRLVVLALAALLGLGVRASAGQSASLRGFVTDRGDGEPLQGVHVVLEGGGRLVGTSTGLDGHFIVSPVPPGRYALRMSYIGYAAYEDTLDFSAGEQKTLSVALDPETIRSEEVVVEGLGERPVLTTAGLQTIRARDIERVPMPDVAGDLMGYLQVLPGMLTPGDRGGQLFVRGGTPSQNLVLLDQIPVYQPFHLLGFFSAFPSDIILQTDVYAGGFGARYGGRLSSVIDVATRNGDKQRFRGAVSVAPFLSAARVEGPLVRDHVSFILSVRESLAERLLPGLWGERLPFRFGDQFLKLHSNLTDGSRLSVTALRTHDRGIVDDSEYGKEVGVRRDLGRAELPDEEIRWRNTAFGLRYLFFPPDLPVLGELTFSISHVLNAFGLPEAAERDSRLRTIRGTSVITHLLGAYQARWGASLEQTRLDYELGGLFQNVETRRTYLNDAGVFGEVDVPFGRGLRVTPGLRLHLSASNDVQSSVEPRLRAVWERDEGLLRQVGAAFGRYHQALVGLQDERDAGDVFTAWVPTPLRETVPEATHAIVGSQWRLRPWLSMSVEGYYKRMRNLTIPAWHASPQFTTTLQPARGRAEGLDVRLEAEQSPFYLYVGYGLARVTYFAQQESFGVWFGTAQEAFNPPHDRRHQVNVLAGVTLAGFDVNVRWQFGSGLPYTRPVGFDDWLMFETPLDVREEAGAYRVIFDRPYQGRLPTYHRLDLSVERTFPAGPANVTVQGGLINAYDRRNLFYFDVWTLRRVDQMPLTPSLGLKLEVP